MDDITRGTPPAEFAEDTRLRPDGYVARGPGMPRDPEVRAGLVEETPVIPREPVEEHPDDDTTPDVVPEPADEASEVDPDLDADADSVPELTDPEELSRVLLAVLLGSRERLKVLRLAEVCNSTQKAVKQGLEALERSLRDQGLPLHVNLSGDAVSIVTVPAVYPYLERLKKLKKAEKLSPAALETLAVIAYRQPVIRAEIESIRGVKAGPILRTLLDHKLVSVVGRADVPGRPLQYGTTQTFLERFGLRSLDDLPSVQEFRSLG